MKKHKQIRFPCGEIAITPMQVLHSFLPELSISGFDRVRTFIFEDDCLARIQYKQKHVNANENIIKRGIKLLSFKNNPLAFTLEINIKPDKCVPRQFNIYSNLQHTHLH